MKLLFLTCLTQAGKRSALAQSAEYPRPFGMAVAALVPERGDVPEDDFVDLTSYTGQDHLGSLHDLIKGRKLAWWRQAYNIH